MVLGTIYDYLTDDIAMLAAGTVLLLAGLTHVFSPVGTTVAQVLGMLGATVTNDLSNVPGLITRVVGIGVTSIGFGMVRDQLM